MGGASFPGIGASQNDSITVRDNVDSTHPLYVDFVLPSNLVKLQAAKLSFVFRAFRVYSQNVAGGSSVTGPGSSHGHSHNHGGHTHTEGGHGHTWSIGFPQAAAANMNNDGAGVVTSNISATVSTSNNAGAGTGATTPATDATTEATHTHSFTTGNPGISEDTTQVPSQVRVSIDGLDQTLALGGPWNFPIGGGPIELVITPYVNMALGTGGLGTWHNVTLSSATSGQVTALVRHQSIVNSFKS